MLQTREEVGETGGGWIIQGTLYIMERKNSSLNNGKY